MACGQFALSITHFTVRAIRNGNFKIKEELPERNYDLWGGGAPDALSKVQPLPPHKPHIIHTLTVAAVVVVTPSAVGPTN